jgi:NADPH:quinone reductase
VLGSVSSLAAQLAAWGGATVIGTVLRHDDLEQVNRTPDAQVVSLDHPDPAAAIRAYAPDGVDRIVEVAFSENVDLDTAIAKNQTIIAARLPLDRVAEVHDDVDAGAKGRVVATIGE